jgi:hypothetical protein
MRRLIRIAVVSCTLALTLQAITGCVQLPTERSGVADIRPQISLRPLDDSVRSARVFIDGIEVGAVSDFAEGVASLRVLPGMHVIKIISGGRTIMDENFYAGDGVNRTFNVNRGF